MEYTPHSYKSNVTATHSLGLECCGSPEVAAHGLHHVGMALDLEWRKPDERRGGNAKCRQGNPPGYRHDCEKKVGVDGSVVGGRLFRSLLPYLGQRA